MAEGQPKTILVIEDDKNIVFALKTFLALEGYQVQVAENGLEAMDILNKEGIPSLILLDMKMPVMDGWKFASEFNTRHDRVTPIIVMTAAADAEKRANEIHANGWIEKPFDFDELLTIIRRHER